MRYLKIFLVVLTFSTTIPALAETVEWSSAAMACTPTSSTVAEGRYVTTAGRVKFKEGQVGTISFVCPVSGELRNGSYILKAHTTSGGPGKTFVNLRRSKKDSFSVTTILDADIYIAIPNNKHESQKSGRGQVVFNTKEFYYWVQLTVKKSDASGELAIHGVELLKQQF